MVGPVPDLLADSSAAEDEDSEDIVPFVDTQDPSDFIDELDFDLTPASKMSSQKAAFKYSKAPQAREKPSSDVRFNPIAPFSLFAQESLESNDAVRARQAEKRKKFRASAAPKRARVSGRD